MSVCLTSQDGHDPEFCCGHRPGEGWGVAVVQDRPAELDGAVPLAGLDHHRGQAGEADLRHAHDALLLAKVAGGRVGVERLGVVGGGVLKADASR